ncbi:hypothetical protein WJX84_006556 [Apatococcus fuscideae]|uniref:Uncharacterized protein n=1 Tax=Apatococcus fuscideae TaxID=2026836 RepID=A0AAW1TIC8_9CHLO
MRDRAKPLDPTSEPVEGTYGVRLTGRYLLAGLRSAGNTFRPVRPSPPPGSHLVAPKLHARSADWWLRRDSTGFLGSAGVPSLGADVRSSLCESCSRDHSALAC